MAACFVLCLVSPAMGWWLPEGASTHADDIDSLYYIILYITAFFFVLTEGILVVFMFKYEGQPGAKPPPRPSTSYVGSLFKPLTKVLNAPNKIELAWTIIPAAILLWIAFVQINTWADVKYKSRMPEFSEKNAPLQVEVSARQFEWRLRYASPARNRKWLADRSEADKVDYQSFKKNPHLDDVRVVNDLHVWKGHPCVVWLSTMDVLHSFNLPHMRVKQDALPGKTLPVWFTPTHANCAPHLAYTAAADQKPKEPGNWSLYYQFHTADEKTNPPGEDDWVWVKKTPQGHLWTIRSPQGITWVSGWEDGYNPKTNQWGDKKKVWDLACAELCGWGHYRMVGRLYVHESQQDWLAWLQVEEAKNQAD